MKRAEIKNIFKSFFRASNAVNSQEMGSGLGLMLVIVTNNVFEDGVCYDESTMNYIKAMGIVNIGLAAMAERVVEVVAGIPVTVK